MDTSIKNDDKIIDMISKNPLDLVAAYNNIMKKRANEDKADGYIKVWEDIKACQK